MMIHAEWWQIKNYFVALMVSVVIYQ